jgi:transcriptional regulator with XRE-family HTH domain
MKRLPEQLKRLMQYHKMNESTLARKINIPQPVINRLLSGSTSNPRVSTLLALAQYFNVSIEALIGEEHIPSEELAKFAHYIYIQNDRSLLEGTTPQQMMMSTTKYKNSFAYQVNHTLLEPRFSQGTLLIISPEKHHKHGDYMMIKKTGGIFIRQALILENSKTFLTVPAIQAMFEPLCENTIILGTVIESYQQHL